MCIRDRNITSSMNTPTTTTEHDPDKQTQHENETIYVNVENTSEQDTNSQILIDPLNIKNEDEGIIDPLNIPENPIQTEQDSSEQILINFPTTVDNSVEDQNNSMIPMDDSNSRLLKENEKYSCKSCGKNICEEKLKTHERFCAK